MKKISNKERHIRWNWEQSPDNPEMARYHFVIVDDKNREKPLVQIVQNLSQVGGIEEVRRVEGHVFGTSLRYLFVSYDSRARSELIEFFRLGKPIKRDYDLKERKKGNIEDYVASLYESS